MVEIKFREKESKIRLTVAIDRITLKVPAKMPQSEIDTYTRLAEGIAAIVQPNLKHTLRGNIQEAHQGHPFYYWCTIIVKDGTPVEIPSKS